MKKTLLISAVLIFFSLAPHVLAQGFVPLAPIEGLTKGVTADTAGLANFFNNLYKFAIGMAAVLAVIMIIWGGLQYATQDIPGAKQEGKDRILQAILGLILVLSPVLVFSIINPSILNLSINLEKLDTQSGPPAARTGSGTVGTGDSTAASASGCSLPRNYGSVSSVACPTRETAQAFAASCSNGTGVVSRRDSNDAYPYEASCNLTDNFAGARIYMTTGEIPNGYWCYRGRTNEGQLGYACQTSKDRCDALVLNRQGLSVYVSGCSPYSR